MRICHESVKEMRSKTPRRICFSTTHAGQPKRVNKPDIVGSFSVPFHETIGPLFKADTNLDLFPNSSQAKFPGYYRTIRSEQEFNNIKLWVETQNTRVFLRDCLDLSVALSMNYSEEAEAHRTPLGELEYQAKYHRNKDAIHRLAELCVRTIRDLHFYRDADCVTAVPPKPEKQFDLPLILTQLISEKLCKPDLTGFFNYGGAKASMKEAELPDKWLQWEKSSLVFKGMKLDHKKVILIDDLYQSGTSMQYVAMKLQESGAVKVCGLSLVKSWKDTDNQ